MILDYLVGSDIEVFLKQGDEIISAEGLISGTKEEPFELNRKGCAISLDGVAAEFNVNPTTDWKEMWEDIVYNLNFIENNLPDGINIAIQPSAYLDEKYLQTPNALRSGCSPDFNPYTREANIAPDFKKTNLRSVGMHIHIGAKVLIDDVELCERLIKTLDLFLGVPSVVLDKDTDRKKLFGKAGCFRFCPKYGVEYRVLSSHFCTKESLQWIFQNVDRAIQFVNNNEELPNEEAIIDCINNNNKEVAEQLIKQYNLLEAYVEA